MRRAGLLATFVVSGFLLLACASEEEKACYGDATTEQLRQILAGKALLTKYGFFGLLATSKAKEKELEKELEENKKKVRILDKYKGIKKGPNTYKCSALWAIPAGKGKEKKYVVEYTVKYYKGKEGKDVVKVQADNFEEVED